MADNKSDSKTDKVRDTKGVADDKSEVGGNSSLDVAADERDFKEQAEMLAREAEADIYGKDERAGDDYLYPDLPPSGNNPRKKNVIAYKNEPTGEANNV